MTKGYFGSVLQAFIEVFVAVDMLGILPIMQAVSKVMMPLLIGIGIRMIRLGMAASFIGEGGS